MKLNLKNILLLVLPITFSYMIFNIFRKKPDDIYEGKLNFFFQEFNQFQWQDKESVKSLIQGAITIESPKSKDIKIGMSKLGGTPDLPITIIWPKFHDKSMQFFGQINFEEIANFHRNKDLPKKGILYFFAYFKNPQGDYGAEYDFIKSKKEYSVIYYDGSINDLEQTTFPSDIFEDYKFPVQKMSFETIFQLPATQETIIIENSGLSETDKKLVVDFSNRYDDGILEQILGHPVPVQYGVDFDWAISYLDINIKEGEIQRRKAEIDEIRPEFVNLLTIPLFEAIGGANAYFGILRKDLQNKNFKKVIFIMQDS